MTLVIVMTMDCCLLIDVALHSIYLLSWSFIVILFVLIFDWFVLFRLRFQLYYLWNLIQRCSSEHVCSLCVSERDSTPPRLSCIVSRVMAFMFRWAVQMLHSKADPFNSRPSACFYHVPGSKATSGTMQPPLIFQPAPLPFHAWHPHCAVSTFSCPICAPTGTVGLQNEVWTDALLKRRYLEAVERDSTSSRSVWNSFPHWTVGLCWGQCSVQVQSSGNLFCSVWDG